MFVQQEEKGIEYLELTEFFPLDFRAVFTCRRGGVSSGLYRSLNLGLHTTDSKEAVRINRKRLARLLNFRIGDFTAAEQVHGNLVYEVMEKDRGRGALNYENAIPGVDALLTDRPALPLILFFADCVPIFLCTPGKKVIAIAHAGWRGTLSGVVLQTLEKMKNIFGVELRRTFAAIGPYITREFYEVNKELAERFCQEFKEADNIVAFKSGSYYLDLGRANKFLLQRAGIREENIVISDYCTFSQRELFYSYRRDGKKTGRMAAVIFRKDNT